MNKLVFFLLLLSTLFLSGCSSTGGWIVIDATTKPEQSEGAYESEASCMTAKNNLDNMYPGQYFICGKGCEWVPELSKYHCDRYCDVICDDVK